MNNIYLLDAVFLARRHIRSLPPFHGARWSAWLRFACADLGHKLNDLALGLHPLRNGSTPIAQGETSILRLLTDDAGLGKLGNLPNALMNTPARGEFSPANLEFLFWRDAVTGASHPPAAPHASPLGPEVIREERELLAGLAQWRIIFHVPLRLALPAGQRPGGSDVQKYCPASFFSQNQALAHLCAKIRILDGEMPHCEPQISANSLVWEEMRYSQSRQIALGGLLGCLEYRGAPGEALAQKLVLGQYLGSGKNPLFGLGYWRIPELDKVRKIPMSYS